MRGPSGPQGMTGLPGNAVSNSVTLSIPFHFLSICDKNHFLFNLYSIYL